MEQWKDYQRKHGEELKELYQSRQAIRETLDDLRQNYTAKMQNRLDQWEKFHHRLQAISQDGNSSRVLSELGRLSRDRDRLLLVQKHLEDWVAIGRATERILQELARDVELTGAIDGWRRLMHMELSTEEPKVLNDNPSLVEKHLERCIHWGEQTIEKQLSNHLLAQLQSRGWPSQVRKGSLDDEALLTLVDQFILMAAIRGDTNVYERVCKAVLVVPIAQRFHFHFSSSRPTNRLDRPEWWLNHLAQVLEENIPLLEDHFELDLDVNQVNEQNNGDITAKSSLRMAFGDVLIKELACRKIVEDVVPSLERLNDPEMLIHQVEELGRFQSRLQPLLPSTITSNPLRCLLMADSILEAWLEAESEAALATLRALFERPHQHGEQSPWETEGITDELLAILNNEITTLFTLPPGEIEWNVRFLNRVIEPLLEFIFDRLDFDIPSFHNTPADVRTLLAQTNVLTTLLAQLRDGWGESMEAIALAANPTYQSLVESNTKGEEIRRPGTIFGHFVELFSALLVERLRPALHDYVWEAWSGPAFSFARAMHYAITRPVGTTTIGMHDDLRRALLDLATAHNLVIEGLNDPEERHQLQAWWLADLMVFLRDRFLRQNYFRVDWSEQVRSDIEQVIQLIKRLMPNLPVERALRRVREAMRIITLPEEARHQLLLAMDRVHHQEQDDELEEEEEGLNEVVYCLEQLGIQETSIAECEVFLQLVKTQ